MLREQFAELERLRKEAIPRTQTRTRIVGSDPRTGYQYGNNSMIESGQNMIIPPASPPTPQLPIQSQTRNPALGTPAPQINALRNTQGNRPIPLTQRLSQIQANLSNQVNTNSSPIVTAQGGKLAPSRFSRF